MKSLALLLIWATAGQVGGEPAELSPGQRIITSDDATIRVRGEDDKDLPAAEQGVLIEMTVREGAAVEAGEVIARIDDSQAQAALEVAAIGLDSARKRAEDDIEYRYAKKQAAVTKTDWQQDLLANEQMKNAVPEITIRRKKLDYERSLLQIEKAQHDAVLAIYDAKSKLAEKKAAQLNIERRVIKAPYDGVVETVYQHEHEWLNPGDPVVRLIRLDKLHVDCFVDSGQYDPVELAGKPVTVTVEMARGRTEELTGRVVFISQTTQSSGEYQVRAEIENRREGDYWVVRPGLPATISIDVGGEASPAVAQARE